MKQFILLTLLLLSFNAYSQDLAHENKALFDTFITEAKKYKDANNFDNAISQINRAQIMVDRNVLSVIYRQNSINALSTLKKSLFTAIISRGDQLLSRKQFDDAIILFDKAKTVAENYKLLPNIKTASDKSENAKKTKIIYENKLKISKKKSNEENTASVTTITIKPASPNPKSEIIKEAKIIYNAYAVILSEREQYQDAKEVYVKLYKYDKEDKEALLNILLLNSKLNDSKIAQKINEINDFNQLKNYLDSSLVKKDNKLAQVIQNKILKDFNEPSKLDAISKIYSNRTGDSHFSELFLSNPAKIEINRDYYNYTKEEPVNDSKKSLEYFTNLVALDDAYLKTITKDNKPIINYYSMGRNYNNLGWYSILNKKFENLIEYFKKSLQFNPTGKIAQGNMPHALLLNGRFEEAKALYVKLKDQDFEVFSDYPNFKAAFLSDFTEFEQAGIIEKGSEIEKQITEIKTLLQN